MSAPGQTQQSHDMNITQAHPQTNPPSYGDTKAVGQYNQAPQQQQQNYQPQHQQQQPMSYSQPAMQQHPGPGHMVTPLDRLADVPQDVDCPNCQRVTRTRVEAHASGSTIAVGVLIGLFCICLAWIPCAAHWMYDKEWFCGNCGTKLAYAPHDSTPIVTAGPGGGVPSQHQGQVQQQYPQQGQIQQGQQPQAPPKQ